MPVATNVVEKRSAIVPANFCTNLLIIKKAANFFAALFLLVNWLQLNLQLMHKLCCLLCLTCSREDKALVVFQDI